MHRFRRDILTIATKRKPKRLASPAPRNFRRIPDAIRARGNPLPLLLLLAVATLVPTAAGMPQEPPDTGAAAVGFRLEQNYPNPFNPETRIPFELTEALFDESGEATVSIRIFNILQQFVAAPVALGYSGGEGLPLLQLEFTAPGRYEAWWDGRDRNGNQVASGVYFVQMIVNDRAGAWRKMFVTK